VSGTRAPTRSAPRGPAPKGSRPARTALHPRIRARRVAVTRAQGRRRLRVLVAAGVTAALVAGAVAILFSGLASARHITVRGSVHTPVPQVLAAAGVASHPPLIEVDPGAVAGDLERLPWVAKATVLRHWPDALTIVITERIAVAVIARRGGVALVDAGGRVLSWGVVAPAGLPVLSAPGAVGVPGTELAAPSRPGLTVVSTLPPALAGRVRAVVVGADHSVTLDLGGGVRAALGQATTLGAKFESLASVLAGANPRGPALIDVTVPDEPLVGPPPTPVQSP
jgi:cell division protein FtsQ